MSAPNGSKWSDDPDGFIGELEKVVRAFHEPEARKLCAELIQDLKERQSPWPKKNANRVLATLRKKRFFKLMEDTARAFLQSGVKDPVIRRHLAQALIELNKIDEAIQELESILDGAEDAEARGLLGRAHKQLYVDATNRPDHIDELRTAYKWYADKYEQNKTEYWHGINAVALLALAKRDNVQLNGNHPKNIAEEILDHVIDLESAGNADMWAYATATEACVALGKSEEALIWLARYLHETQKTTADLFPIHSTLRQFEQVWELSTNKGIGTVLLPALRAEILAKKDGGVLEIPTDDTLHHIDHAVYERVFGNQRFQTLEDLMTAIDRARSVAKIEQKLGHPIGTGFLVKGNDLHPVLDDRLFLLTNAHVIAPKADKRIIKIEFEALKAVGASVTKFAIKEILWSSPPTEYDATLIQLDRQVANVNPYPIAKALPTLDPTNNSHAYIIGHPKGWGLRFSLMDSLLLDHEERYVHYRTPTEPGSSGSPVFNHAWQLIALHHGGKKDLQRLNGKSGTYEANEGISILEIIKAMQKNPPKMPV